MTHDDPTAHRQIGSLSISSTGLGDLLHAVLEKGASFRFRAAGQSMQPAIRDRDIITVSPTGRRPPCPGEIVVVRPPGTTRIIVHRVVGVRRGRYVIRGDNRRAIDAAVPPDRIIGVVTRIEAARRLPRLPDRVRHPRWCCVFWRLRLLAVNARLFLRRVRRFVNRMTRPPFRR